MVDISDDDDDAINHVEGEVDSNDYSSVTSNLKIVPIMMIISFLTAEFVITLQLFFDSFYQIKLL